jgi:hypothetical protein
MKSGFKELAKISEDLIKEGFTYREISEDMKKNDKYLKALEIFKNEKIIKL